MNSFDTINSNPWRRNMDQFGGTSEPFLHVEHTKKFSTYAGFLLDNTPFELKEYITGEHDVNLDTGTGSIELFYDEKNSLSRAVFNPVSLLLMEIEMKGASIDESEIQKFRQVMNDAQSYVISIKPLENTIYLNPADDENDDSTDPYELNEDRLVRWFAIPDEDTHMNVYIKLDETSLSIDLSYNEMVIRNITLSTMFPDISDISPLESPSNAIGVRNAIAPFLRR